MHLACLNCHAALFELSSEHLGEGNREYDEEESENEDGIFQHRNGRKYSYDQDFETFDTRDGFQRSCNSESSESRHVEATFTLWFTRLINGIIFTNL